MSPYFTKPYKPSSRNIKVELDLSNYATKVDLIKAEFDKVGIDKSENVPKLRSR